MNSSEFEERVFEVEKSRVVSGKEIFSKEYLDAREDGPAWFEARTGRALTGLENLTLPIGWKWSSNWKISMNEQGSDVEGWIISGNIRRRRWFRKREKIISSSSVVSTNSSSASKSSTTSSIKLDEGTIIRKITEALQRLDISIQKLSIANEKSTIEQIIREGKEAVSDAQSALESLGGMNNSSEKPTTRAAKIKLTNDLIRDRKRFDLVSNEAYVRGGGGGERKKQPIMNTKSQQDRQNGDDDNVDNVDDNELNRQQEQLHVYEQQHRQILSHEIDTNAQLINERHKEIQEIHKLSTTVNGMMKELAQYVNEQDDSIKTAAKSASTARNNVTRGLVEVEKADKYQQEGGACIIS